jgi:copper chaperone CopZ
MPIACCVRRSLLRVKGVKAVRISQASQMANFMATITFDDSVANKAALIAATTKVSYPSFAILDHMPLNQRSSSSARTPNSSRTPT